MATIVSRIYNGKDVDMLITAATIMNAAINHKVFLQNNRPLWLDPFFEDLAAEIENAIQTHLGIDSSKNLREATHILYQIQANAIIDLALIKIQISEDFKADRIRKEEILNQLGFTPFLKDVQKKDQEALINLLFQFKTYLNPNLRAEIVAKGTSDSLLTKVVNYADTIKNADIFQESNKGIKKTITAEAITDFNSVYSKIISVSKIAHKLFKGSPAIQQQFSFYKIARTINANKSHTSSHHTKN
ncbi:hypothetical protein OX284_003040 [Flavobacterium sp. SUN046]|uniref:hypothetical protein n=1 Tax=Flavobacterium sp. SUN046 TaxID=3002440 RepID=UPI002DBE5FCE|nr:hypothetical protein [Flavobacterium sp. SUN046]MEC4048392.1 hypothetical protein [Flavobacterium sp. SUN046]